MSAPAPSFIFSTRDVAAALRFVDDVTGRAVPDMVRIEAEGLAPYRKANGDVILFGPVAAGARWITLRPGTPAYAPRLATLTLPRPVSDSDPNSVFRPQDIRLQPSADYPVAGNLAALRVTLSGLRPSGRHVIGGALLRLTSETAGLPGATAVTNVAGEALLIVAGLPLMKTDDLTATPHFSYRLDGIADPASPATTLVSVGALDALAQAGGFTQGAPVDPDVLSRGAAPAFALMPSLPVSLAAGLTATIAADWQPLWPPP